MSMPVNVLMVDAEPPAAPALQAAFSAAGITLLWAASTVDALALLARHEVALTVLAAEPKALSALAAQLRAAPGQRDLPLILLADSAAEAAALFDAAALDASPLGAVDVLTRPVVPGVFLCF